MKNNLPLSCVVLSKDKLLDNLKTLKSVTLKGTKISVAVKGNAYGHGLEEVVKILNPKVDYFQIDSIEELVRVRKVSKKPVLMLGYVQKSDLERAMKLGCHLSVFSIDQLDTISKIASIQKKIQTIHLSIDAHLGREGVLVNDLSTFFMEAKKLKNIKVVGIYAHFANIEDTTNKTHAKKQIKEYERAVAIAEKFGYKSLQRHMSATSGLLVYETYLSTGMNKNKFKANHLVRLGVGVYGMWPSKNIEFLYKNKMELKPVLSWKTKVAQIKNLPAGHTVGYGLTYMTYVPTKIALIPQGYADGLDRRLSNVGEVLIRGVKCKIIGRVSMNMCTVDVTHLSDVALEDEAIIIGSQNKLSITSDDVAQKIGTINYEVTTRLSSLLPRIID